MWGKNTVTMQNVAVMPRKRHVSRNITHSLLLSQPHTVMPRKRHVSRNIRKIMREVMREGHASQEACE